MIRRRIFAAAGVPQRPSISRKKSATRGTSGSQRFGEVSWLQSRDDSPTLGNRRRAGGDFRKRLLASDAGVEHVRQRGLLLRLRRQEVEKRSEHDLRAIVQPPPRRRRYAGELVADCLERVFDEPSEPSSKPRLGELEVKFLQVESIDVGDQDWSQRG